MKKILILTLLLLFSLIFGGNILSHVNEVKAFEENKSALDSTKKDNILSTSLEYIAGYNESNSYYGVYDAWQEINAVMPEEVVIIKSNEIIGGEAVLQGDSFGYQSDTVKAGPSDTISFNLEVTEEGLYEFYFDYYLLEGTLLRPTIAFEVNGEVQYNEMYNLDIPLRWKVEEDLVYDRFGDEITPNSFLESEWGSFALSDPNYFFVEPLKIYLPEGESEVTITVNEGFVLFGDITVGNLYEEASPYSEYQNSMPSATDDVETITLQAERYTYESKQNIRAKFVRNPSLTPYSYKNRVLNVLDQTSYRKSGDSVTYSFNVEETGYYNISLKYLQSENDGLSSARAIYIDGEIPFKEFENWSSNFTFSMYENATPDHSETVLSRQYTSTSTTLARTRINDSSSTRDGFNSTGRLQFKGAPGETLTLMPFVVYSRSHNSGTIALSQTQTVSGASTASTDSANTSGDGNFGMARLNGQWRRKLSADSSMEWKFNTGGWDSSSHTYQTPTGGGSVLPSLSQSSTTRSFSQYGTPCSHISK